MRARTQATLLSNGNRMALVATVRREPGRTVGELAQELGLSYKTALYHVRLLQRAELLRVERANMRSRVLPSHEAFSRGGS